MTWVHIVGLFLLIAGIVCAAAPWLLKKLASMQLPHEPREAADPPSLKNESAEKATEEELAHEAFARLTWLKQYFRDYGSTEGYSAICQAGRCLFNDQPKFGE